MMTLLTFPLKLVAVVGRRVDAVQVQLGAFIQLIGQEGAFAAVQRQTDVWSCKLLLCLLSLAGWISWAGQTEECGHRSIYFLSTDEELNNNNSLCYDSSLRGSFLRFHYQVLLQRFLQTAHLQVPLPQAAAFYTNRQRLCHQQDFQPISSKAGNPARRENCMTIPWKVLILPLFLQLHSFHSETRLCSGDGLLALQTKDRGRKVSKLRKCVQEGNQESQ